MIHMVFFIKCQNETSKKFLNEKLPYKKITLDSGEIEKK